MKKRVCIGVGVICFLLVGVLAISEYFSVGACYLRANENLHQKEQEYDGVCQELKAMKVESLQDLEDWLMKFMDNQEVFWEMTDALQDFLDASERLQNEILEGKIPPEEVDRILKAVS